MRNIKKDKRKEHKKKTDKRNTYKEERLNKSKDNDK